MLKYSNDTFLRWYYYYTMHDDICYLIKGYWSRKNPICNDHLIFLWGQCETELELFTGFRIWEFSSYLFCCCEKILWQKKQFIWGKGLIKFKGYSKSLKDIREDTQQKLETTPMEEQCWLSESLIFSVWLNSLHSPGPWTYGWWYYP